MALKVIGAGFGRTGTLSLKKALELLDYERCYHMSEVVGAPEHNALWRAAWRGDDPWEALFHGFRAAVDWPACAFWPRLMEVYPDAKVILTVRDAESWFESATETIFRSMTEGMQVDDPLRRERMVMAKEIIVDGTFGGDLTDKAAVIAAYEANVARVRAEVPPERLIVFDGRDGWGPLCQALNKPEPAVPYPRINSRSEFHSRWRGGDPRREMPSR